MKTKALCLFLLLLTSQFLWAQCGPGGCRLPAYPLHASYPLTWKKTPLANDDGRYYLWQGLTQLGGWDTDLGYYRTYDQSNGAWGPKVKTPPIPLPDEAIALTLKNIKDKEDEEANNQKKDWRTDGVMSFGNDGKDRFTINGQEVSEQEARQAMTLEDDSQGLWLIVNGDQDKRDKYLEDLDKAKVFPDKKKVRVWSVPSDHFSLMDRDTGKPMFNNTGNPSITLMQPEGQVLYMQDGRKDNDIDAIRKSDPTAPKKSPDDALRPIIPNSVHKQVPVWVLIALAGTGLYLFAKGTSK